MMMMMNYDLVFTAANKKNVQQQMIILSTGQIAKDQEQHQRDVWTEFLGFLKQRAAKQVSIQGVSKNIARIANAVQVTICLLVSTSVY